MNNQFYLISLAEGTKISSEQLKTLQNSAFQSVREKVSEFQAAGESPDRIIGYLGELAASHLAAYQAYSQELAAMGINLRKQEKADNAAKDRADKLSAKFAEFTEDTHADKNKTRVLRPASQSRPSSKKDSDKEYTKKERDLLKLFTTLGGDKFSSMEEICKPMCLAKGINFNELTKKFEKLGRKGL